MLKKIFLAAITLAVILPAGAAFAHDGNEEGSHGYYGERSQDYGEHRAYNEGRGEGYYNRENDGAWRERQREAREERQESYRNSWHDRYGWRGTYGASQYGYPNGSYYGYRGY